ncbi:uncharacterized protein LOC118796001 isoform X2 [Megalops cyprinoides]|uniref:uncharacterized protein LOC118796001 isoform X2 n=1 Tax=Megalops cyprinoides TaxID=118141 RepID=UPI001864847D|nr:uncharacterized protein LOC118796001 isoform X2 [Megalops cyprinoides]
MPGSGWGETAMSQAPEALEDPVNDSGCSEVGDPGPEEYPEAQEWSDLAQEQAQDTTEEYFDTHSWHSDTLSDLSPDGEDCPAVPPGVGGPCVGWQPEPDLCLVGCGLYPRDGSHTDRQGPAPVETYPNFLDLPHETLLDGTCLEHLPHTVLQGRGRTIPECTEPAESDEALNGASVSLLPKEAGLPLSSGHGSMETAYQSPEEKELNGAELHFKPTHTYGTDSQFETEETCIAHTRFKPTDTCVMDSQFKPTHTSVTDTQFEPTDASVTDPQYKLTDICETDSQVKEVEITVIDSQWESSEINESSSTLKSIETSITEPQFNPTVISEPEPEVKSIDISEMEEQYKPAEMSLAEPQLETSKISITGLQATSEGLASSEELRDIEAAYPTPHPGTDDIKLIERAGQQQPCSQPWGDCESEKVTDCCDTNSEHGGLQSEGGEDSCQEERETTSDDSQGDQNEGISETHQVTRSFMQFGIEDSVLDTELNSNICVRSEVEDSALASLSHSDVHLQSDNEGNVLEAQLVTNICVHCDVEENVLEAKLDTNVCVQSDVEENIFEKQSCTNVCVCNSNEDNISKTQPHINTCVNSNSEEVVLETHIDTCVQSDTEDSVLETQPNTKACVQPFSDNVLEAQPNTEVCVQFVTEEQVKECHLLPQKHCEVICSDELGLASSSELQSEALSEEGGLSVQSSSEEKVDSSRVPQKQEVGHLLNPPESPAESFEVSKEVGLQNLTSTEESIPCLVSSAGMPFETTTDLDLNCKQFALGGSDITSGASEASAETPASSKHLNDSQNIVANVHPFQGDIVVTCASNPDSSPVRTVQITLDIPQEKFHFDHPWQIGMSGSPYFQKFRTPPEWHFDTNNNSTTGLESCSVDPHNAVLEARAVTSEPLDSLSGEITYNSEDNYEEDSSSLLQANINDDGTSCSGSDLENSAWDAEDIPNTLDHEACWTNQDSVSAEGVHSELDLPEGGEIMGEMQGGPQCTDRVSQDAPTNSPHLPPHTDVSCGESITWMSNAETNRQNSEKSEEYLQETLDTESSVDTALEDLVFCIETKNEDQSLSHTVEKEEYECTVDYTAGSSIPSMIEEYTASFQPCLESLQPEFETVRYPYSDSSLNLLSVNNLEPILEADRSQENSFIMEEDRNAEEEDEGVHGSTVTPVQEGESGGTSCVQFTRQNDTLQLSPPRHLATEDSVRDDLPSTETEVQPRHSTPEPDDNKATTALPNGDVVHEVRRTPTPVSQDLDTTSTNSEETDDSLYSLLGSNPSLNKAAKNKATKAGSTGKSSKFSVFSRIPSFRRSKNMVRESNSCKAEPQEGADRGEESREGSPENKPHPTLVRAHLSLSSDHLREATRRGENLDDDVFEKGDLPDQTVGDRPNADEHGFCQSTLHTRHVRQLYSQPTGDRDAASSQEALNCKSSPAVERLSHKRSKSSDSLNLRMRFALAHRSLSSLFESRSPEKETEEEFPKSEHEKRSTRPSWRMLKQTKEAETLKRALSVPDPGTGRSARQVHSDYALRSAQDRLQGSSAGRRGSRHSDPLSKKGAPRDQPEDSLDESKTEETRRGGPPNGLSMLCPDASQLSSDDTDFPLPGGCRPTSPLSPNTVAALAHQLAPSWARSLGSFESMEGPLRPQSPKPQSPRLGSHRRSFRYPSRATTVSLLSLGQGVSVEGLSDPPERPKTLKPRVSQLASVNSLNTEWQREDSGVDSQSQIALVTSMSINEFELMQDGGKPAAQSPEKRLPDLGCVLRVRSHGQRRRGPRPISDLGSWAIPLPGEGGAGLELGAGQGADRQRRCCSDDLWIEDEKSRERKMNATATTAGSLNRLTAQLSEEAGKARARLSLNSTETFPSMALKDQCFSQSTPIGLDCVGWPRRISYPGRPRMTEGMSLQGYSIAAKGPISRERGGGDS